MAEEKKEIKEEKAKEVEYHIISRKRTITRPTPWEEIIVIRTEFWTDEIPYMYVEIPEKEWTKEKEIEKIREAIKAWKPTPPEVGKVII